MSGEAGTCRADDGCAIAWRAEGSADAPALILSNSLGSNLTMWEAQVADFARHFRVIRYDQRGHGGANVPDAEATLARLGNDVITLLDHLDIARAHFCGVSLGGMTGQWLAINAPARFERMVFSCTSPYLGPPSGWQDRIDTVLTEGMAPIVEAIVSRWVTPTFASANPTETDRLRAMVGATDPRGYAACCAAIRDMDLRPNLTDVQLPVLVISGTQDPATPPAMGEALAAAIAGAEMQVLQGAHLANIECAERFNQIVVSFLNGGTARVP